MVDAVRRKPQQKRSAATVRAILDAASQVLARDGIDRLTTAAVAERAGVGIGSLYQYFANKDDLLVALARRALVAFQSSIAAGFADAAPGTRKRSVVVGIMRVFAATEGDDPNLHLVLRLGGRAPLVADIATFATQFGAMDGEAKGLSPEAIFVMTRAVLGVVSSLPHADAQLDRTRIEAELERMVDGFFAHAIGQETNPTPSAA